MDYVKAIIMSIIIIFLRIKTDIFETITSLFRSILRNKKTMRVITGVILVIIPAICFIILLKIANLLVIETIPNIINNVKEEHYFLGIIDFLKDCVRYSPVFWLIMCFLLQDHHKENSITGSNNDELETLLGNMKISTLSNYITASIFTISIYTFIKLNIFEMKVFDFFAKYFTTNIELYSENSLKMILIIILGIICYFGINIITINYMTGAMEWYNKIYSEKITRNKILIYKILLLIPAVNIFTMYLIKKRLKN
jgi:hypothetical protein